KLRSQSLKKEPSPMPPQKTGTPTETADVAQLDKLATDTDLKEKPPEPELPGMPAAPAPIPEKKKSWSRRKKIVPAPAPALVLPRELVKSMIQAPYALAARYLGPGFELT